MLVPSLSLIVSSSPIFLVHISVFLLRSQAVSGMLPKNALRVERMKQLKIYAAETHPHVAQFPLQLTAASPIEAYVSFPRIYIFIYICNTPYILCAAGVASGVLILPF